MPGGILNYGSVTLTGSALTNNTASGTGGGLSKRRAGRANQAGGGPLPAEELSLEEDVAP